MEHGDPERNAAKKHTHKLRFSFHPIVTIIVKWTRKRKTQ